MNFEKLTAKPVLLYYEQPSADQLTELKQQAALQSLQPNEFLLAENSYHKNKMAGTFPKIYGRAAVFKRLEIIAKQLQPHAGLIIFDVFRTLETQQALFDDFLQIIAQRHPQWNQEQVLQETLKFVSKPEYRSNYVPPHNSGGAVDLAIFSTHDNKLWDFGSGFDEIADRSSTLFYEQEFSPTLGISQTQWITIRNNRRILFHLMQQQGFTNYENEWWHYDLGDYLWGKKLNITPIYDSLEAAVREQNQAAHYSHIG